MLFFLGVGGANFAMYTLWLPEQYSTECRASAFAFATSVGRFAGAGITFLVGAGVAHFHTIGTPVALTSIAFLIGLLLLPFGEETRGKPLPDLDGPLTRDAVSTTLAVRCCNPPSRASLRSSIAPSRPRGGGSVIRVLD